MCVSEDVVYENCFWIKTRIVCVNLCLLMSWWRQKLFCFFPFFQPLTHWLGAETAHYLNRFYPIFSFLALSAHFLTSCWAAAAAAAFPEASYFDVGWLFCVLPSLSTFFEKVRHNLSITHSLDNCCRLLAAATAQQNCPMLLVRTSLPLLWPSRPRHWHLHFTT